MYGQWRFSKRPRIGAAPRTERKLANRKRANWQKWPRRAGGEALGGVALAMLKKSRSGFKMPKIIWAGSISGDACYYVAGALAESGGHFQQA